MLSTTELLVEHIISGILSLVWLSGIFFCFIDFDWSQFSITKEYWIILTLFITAIAYPVGIFVDTLADKILSRQDLSIKRKYYTNPTINILHMIKRANDSNITSYFTYNRFKSRIARSSFLNFLLISIIFPIFLSFNYTGVGISKPFTLGIVIVLIFLLLAASSLYVWKETSYTIHKRTNELWNSL